MTLKEQLEERRKQWAAFHRWEAEQPPIDRAPAEIIADIGAIWGWFSPEVRTQDPDPEKLGVWAMHAALRHLKSSS